MFGPKTERAKGNIEADGLFEMIFGAVGVLGMTAATQLVLEWMHELVMGAERQLGIEGMHEMVKRAETRFLIMAQLGEEVLVQQLALETSMAASEVELWG